MEGPDRHAHADGKTTSEVTTSVRPDLKPLTSLRFVAALMVFIYHVPTREPLAYLLAIGQEGVGFFFVLSGFILTYVYRDFAEATTREGRWTFLVARFARIYPTYVVAMVLAFAVLLIFGSSDTANNLPEARIPTLLAQLGLVQSWFPAAAIHYGGNGPSWSISDEAFFYVLFPFLLFAIATRVRHLTALAILLWSVVVAIAWLVPGTVGDWVHFVFPLTRLLDFTVGIVVGVLFIRRKDQRVKDWRGTVWEVAVVELVVISFVVLMFVPATFKAATVMLPAWAFLIYVMAHQRGRLSRWLSVRLRYALVKSASLSTSFTSAY